MQNRTFVLSRSWCRRAISEEVWIAADHRPGLRTPSPARRPCFVREIVYPIGVYVGSPERFTFVAAYRLSQSVAGVIRPHQKGRSQANGFRFITGAFGAATCSGSAGSPSSARTTSSRSCLRARAFSRPALSRVRSIATVYGDPVKPVLDLEVADLDRIRFILIGPHRFSLLVATSSQTPRIGPGSRLTQCSRQPKWG